MSAPIKPLLFPQIFDSPGLWTELGKAHGLLERDFRWLAHAQLSSDALRGRQTPAMRAECIWLNVDSQIPLPLPGAFVLSETADKTDEKSLFLYTPYDGVRKHYNRALLKQQLEYRLNNADDQDNLLAFLALSQRKQLLDAERISLTFRPVSGDVFDAQVATLHQGQTLNTQAMRDELRQLPALTQLLNSALDELLQAHFGTLQQSRTRVSFYTEGANGSAAHRHWHDSMSLSEAVLTHYRHQRWPGDALREFAHPGRVASKDDQQQWDAAVQSASSKLPALLFRQLEKFWDAPCADGSSRRAFFVEVLEDQARTEWMVKRETGILDADQFNTLHQLIRPNAHGPRRPLTETVRLWEYEANYVELAGSLMIISDAHAFLYTPAQGLQQLNDYHDLQHTLQSKFMANGHEDELYSLLGLEERNRFLGFDQPQVSGERTVGETFRVLFELIITKQRQNVEYALQVFRHSDGAVNLHALFDKSLDIRSMIHEHLLALDSAGRWSTHPVLSGAQQPSMVLADKAREALKTFDSVESPLAEVLKSQPVTSLVAQRTFLESLKASLAHAWFVGLSGEARLRTLGGSLPSAVQAIVNTVINANRPTRALRAALDGFRPDAYALTLQAADQQRLLPLAHCLLMTERGGLDVQHSGCAVLWTPAFGLEVFDTLALARSMLDQRLLDPVQRLALLENILPAQQQAHQRYTLGAFQFIEDNVLHNRMQSTIEHFLGRCQQVRTRVADPVKRHLALAKLYETRFQTNLQLATAHARAIATQQTCPAWLGMAPVAEQKLHVELLGQWQQSVVDAKDYLSGVPSLVSYVEQALKALLDSRFPGSALNPQQIEVIPNLTLAGPARTLVEFALNHANVAQGTGFKVASTTTRALPAGLDQSAVTQLLLSLTIPATFGKTVTDALSISTDAGRARKQRFFRQLPWQLLQHAHTLKLQQHLSETAFSYIRQVLDMPDALARAAVDGAHAVACPLALIKTAGANAVTASGLYLLTPGSGHKGPLVLYAPYAEQAFHEFVDENALIAAFNRAGLLQNLLLRRLPETQRGIFRGLLTSSLGQTSEFRLANVAIGGNLLEHLYQDNQGLLQQMLGSQKHSERQSEWETAKTLFSDTVQQTAEMLQGKLACFRFLWQAYDDFKDSAENLQNHHWKRALQSFIEGAAQMVSVGLLPEIATETAIATESEFAGKEAAENIVPYLADIDSTCARRAALQPFETTEIALKDLAFSSSEGIYRQSSTRRNYAALNGKVYEVVKHGPDWRLARAEQRGPTLRKKGARMVQVSEGQSVHYGKAFSKMLDRGNYTRIRRTILNIEAHGMEEISRRFPHKARVLGRAVALARDYALRCLHNLAILDVNEAGGRVNRFLMELFDVSQISAAILLKITNVIVPICKALVDENDDLLNTDRFIVGSTRLFHDVIAFVLDGDQQRKVHFTQHFFDQQLAHYLPVISQPFEVDAHAQAETLIHEFAHQFSRAWDIATTRGREPFCDLISPVTPEGARLLVDLQDHQRMALSLATPRAQLFAEWNTELNAWLDYDKVPGMELMSQDILRVTSSHSMSQARNAFMDQNDPDARINVILLNADSIARLICEVGRQLDTPTP